MLEQELDLYWKTVVDTIQHAIMIIDKGGTIVAVNNRAFEKTTKFNPDRISRTKIQRIICV